MLNRVLSTILLLAGLVAFSVASSADDRRPGDEHQRRGHRDYRDEHRRYPVYAPRQVYVDPRPSVGINLFIPFSIR